MIPVSWLLIPFLLFVVAMGVFTFFNAYHLVRYGKAGLATWIIIILYLATVLFTGLFTVNSLLGVNWDAAISPFEMSSDTSLPFLFPSFE